LKKVGIPQPRLNKEWETDSEKVPWGKDEKDSEQRVKRIRNCWKGSDYLIKREIIMIMIPKGILLFRGYLTLNMEGDHG